MPTDEMIINLLTKTARPGINNLITYLCQETDYFTAPASTKYHSNYEGGLAEHSLKVMELWDKKNELYKLNIPDESIVICALLHDLCKCNFYVKGKKNVKEGKKPDGRDNWVEKEVWDIDDKLPYGHGAKSVILLQQFIKLTEFEILAILHHMGLPETYSDRSTYSTAVEKYPAIITLHTSDVEASYLFEQTVK